jgi:hypothetical protein
MNTDDLIDRLGADARPVTSLAPPLRRAAALLAVLALIGTALVIAGGDTIGMVARYGGDQALMIIENVAMAATGLLAVIGAFALSVPGASRRWLIAPLPPFAIWLLASGLGCYRDLLRLGSGGVDGRTWRIVLGFIVGGGLLIGGPLLWRLSRARPVDPLPVALLGRIGIGGAGGLLLQFFHPFGLTVIDLAIHFGAVLIVVAISGLLRRRTLAPRNLCRRRYE